MPTMFHIADERKKSRILSSGLKAPKGSKGIFCMPVTQNFTVTHQWVREMRRWNGKSLMGIYFKLKSSERVLFGKYGTRHEELTLGQAMAKFLVLENKLGYEFIVKRNISIKEIARVKSFLPNVGWRYYPSSHGDAPIGPTQKEKKKLAKMAKKITKC